MPSQIIDWLTHVQLWSYWLDSLIFLFCVGGLLFNHRVGNKVCFWLKHYPINKFIKTLLGMAQLPIQIMFMTTTLYLLLSYHPFQLQIHKALFDTLIILLTGWAGFRIANNMKAVVLLFDNNFNHSFHLIAVPLFRRLAKLIVWFFLFLALFSAWGYNFQMMLTGVGLTGIILTFIIKDLIANIFGAIMLIISDAFDIGDWIETDTLSGTVEDMSLRFTKLRPQSEGLVTIPNSQLANGKIINLSRTKTKGIEVAIKVDPQSSIETINDSIQDIKQFIKEEASVLPDSVHIMMNSHPSLHPYLSIQCQIDTTHPVNTAKIQTDIYIKALQILKKDGIYLIPSIEKS